MYCPVCQSNQLVLHQINLEEAVYLCQDQDCTYPIGCEWVLVKRKLEEIYSEPQASTQMIENFSAEIAFGEIENLLNAPEPDGDVFDLEELESMLNATQQNYEKETTQSNVVSCADITENASTSEVTTCEIKYARENFEEEDGSKVIKEAVKIENDVHIEKTLPFKSHPMVTRPRKIKTVTKNVTLNTNMASEEGICDEIPPELRQRVLQQLRNKKENSNQGERIRTFSNVIPFLKTLPHSK